MGLSAHNLSTGYGDRVIASGIDVDLLPGQLTVLIGANGSGKSTLLRTLTGSQPPIAGSVTLDGAPVGSYRPALLARKLSLVLTDRTGGGGLTVEEVVGIGRHPYSGFLGRLGADDRRIVADAIRAVGLEHKSRSFLASLSDGERQKAMIARAIAQHTDIIVLDEPTSFLDVSSRFEIMTLLSRMAADHGKTILLSTHDIAPALAVATRLWAITPPAAPSASATLHSGTLDTLAASGILDTIYPGVAFDSAIRDFRQK